MQFIHQSLGQILPLAFHEWGTGLLGSGVCLSAVADLQSPRKCTAPGPSLLSQFIFCPQLLLLWDLALGEGTGTTRGLQLE